jgi:hypothetical protein
VWPPMIVHIPLLVDVKSVHRISGNTSACSNDSGTLLEMQVCIDNANLNKTMGLK